MPTRNNTDVRVHLQGYKMASAGMRSLQSALNDNRETVVAEVIRKFRDNVLAAVTTQTYRLNKRYCILNWGVPMSVVRPLPAKPGYFTLNNLGTDIASDKLLFFRDFSGTGLLPWYTTDRNEAQHRVNSSVRSASNPVIVERHILGGHSGNGIRLVYPDQAVQAAPLYTSYELKKDEYRVHFFKHPGEATQYFVQQKRMRREHEGREDGINRFKVRNHVNGWVFCNQDVDTNSVVMSAANLMANATTLDFGAIDVIYNHSQRRAYVLEINTAPGIEGSTVEWYVSQVKTACKNHDFTSTTGVYSA